MARLEEGAGRETGENAVEDERAARRTVLARENFMLDYSNCTGFYDRQERKCWKKQVMDGHHHLRLRLASFCFVSS